MDSRDPWKGGVGFFVNGFRNVLIIIPISRCKCLMTRHKNIKWEIIINMNTSNHAITRKKMRIKQILDTMKKNDKQNVLHSRYLEVGNICKHTTDLVLCLQVHLWVFIGSSPGQTLVQIKCTECITLSVSLLAFLYLVNLVLVAFALQPIYRNEQVYSAISPCLDMRQILIFQKYEHDQIHIIWFMFYIQKSVKKTGTLKKYLTHFKVQMKFSAYKTALCKVYDLIRISLQAMHIKIT